MDEKQLQALFEAMKGHLDLGDYNTFKNSIYSDSNFRKAFYGEASKNLELGDYATFDNSFKKKELGGGVLSFAGGQVGNGKAPLNEKERDEKYITEDPVGYVNNKVNEQLNRMTSGYEENVGLMKKPVSDATKVATNLTGTQTLKSFQQLQQEKKIFEREFFPTANDAANYLIENNDNGKDLTTNKTISLARDVVKDTKNALVSLGRNNGNLEQAAIDYTINSGTKLGKQVSAMVKEKEPLDDYTKGLTMYNLLNSHAFRNLDEGNPLKDVVDMAKKQLPTAHPSLYFPEIKEKISQKREEDGYNNWFYNNPSVEISDKIMNELRQEGKVDDAEMQAYQAGFRPYLNQMHEFGAGNEVLKTPGIIEGYGQSITHQMKSALNFFPDILELDNILTSKGEKSKSELKEQQELYNEPKWSGLHSVSKTFSNIMGIVTMAGLEGGGLGALGVGKDVTNAAVTGMNFFHDIKKREDALHKDNPELAYISALIQTGLWMKGTEIFGNVAKDVVGASRTEINNVLKSLQNKIITNAQAAQSLGNIFLNKVIKGGKGAITDAAKIQGIQTLTNVTSKILNGDFDISPELETAAKDLPALMMSLLPLKIVGAKGKDMVRDNLYALAKDRGVTDVKNNPEVQDNLNYLKNTYNTIKGLKLSEEQTKDYLFYSMQEKSAQVEKDKTNNKTLSSRYDEQIEKAKLKQEAILAGKNPDEVKTDNEIELERLQKDKELSDKDFEAKRKQLDGRTPEDRPKIEKLEEDKKRAEEDYQREVEKLSPKVKPEETFPEGENIPSQEVTQKPEQPQAISSKEEVGKVRVTAEQMEERQPSNIRQRYLDEFTNVEDSSFDFRMSSSLASKDRKKAVEDIKTGKNTAAARLLEKEIKESIDKGTITINRGRGNSAETIEMPIEEWFQFTPIEKENILKTADKMDDFTTSIIRDNDITLQNIDELKHLFDGFPYTKEDLTAVKDYLSRQGESGTQISPISKEGEGKISIVSEATKTEIHPSPEVKQPIKAEVSEVEQPTEKGTAEPPPEKPTEPVVEEGGDENLPERRFTKQMLRSDELSETDKTGIEKTKNYIRQTHEMTLEAASEAINKIGLDEAQNLVMNDTDLHPAVRVTVGMTLIKKYSELAQKAENQETKDYYHDKSIQTATFVTEKLATEPGQMIEAFSMWSRLSPEAQLRAANQDMARQGKEKLRRTEKDIKVISDKFQKANEEAADELTKSENVKKAVEKTESKRTTKAKDKIAAARKARENIIKKYKGERGKNLYAGIGLTKEGIEFVGDLVKTYVQEGVAKLEIVIDKVLQHLKEVSGKEPNDEVKRNVTDIVKEQIEKKENLRITEGLSELEKEVNKIVREHYTVPEEAKKKLIDKFIEKAGLEKEDAEQLAKEIESEFDKIATRKKRNILYNEKARFDKINNTLKGAKEPEKKTVANDIIKYSNLGAFESKDFSEMMANKFGLGEISPDQAAKLLELAKRIEKAPEGSPKRDATEDLLAYRAKLRGNDLMETAQSVWYANILSGYKTHEKNIVSTFLNSWGELGAEMLKDPKAIPYLLGGYIKGLSRRGFVEALHTLKTGRSPIHIKKIEVPNILERKKFALGGWNPGNWFKYVMRFMVASDVVSFQGLKEARAYQLARRVAGQEGFNTWSKKGWDRVNEILLHTKERYNEATEQLKNEGLLKENGKITNEGKRRLYELMEQNRPVKMTEDAYEFAAHGTYNYASKGTLGAITNAVSGALDAVNIGGFKPLRIIVPFTRIITNVVNNSLDFTPIGFVRAARGVRGFRTFEKSQFTKGAFKELTREERQRLVAKAAIGITFAATLQALHQAGVIQITGNGPTDQKKRKQLMQEGWHPYSVKVGNKYYSYQYTPLVFVVGFLGNMNDAAEYNEKEDKTSFMKRIELAASRIGGQVADMTWINSAGTFLGALTESNPAMQEKKLSGLLTNTAKGFIPFSGAITQGSQLAQNIFEWPQKDVNNAWQGMIQDIPIARNSLNDRINALGEPILRDNDVFISKETSDPVWKFLLDKKGWVSSVNKETIIIFDPELKMDRPVTGDEYYEFAKLRGKMIRDEIQKIMDNGATVIDENGNTKTKEGKDLSSKELNILLKDIEKTATTDAKAELFEPKEEMRPIIYPNESKVNKVKTLNK